MFNLRGLLLPKRIRYYFKIFDRKKRPSLWRERNKGIKNKTVAVRDDGGYEPIINVTLLGK